jgi:hypothetical protein
LSAKKVVDSLNILPTNLVHTVAAPDIHLSQVSTVHCQFFWTFVQRRSAQQSVHTVVSSNESGIYRCMYFSQLAENSPAA